MEARSASPATSQTFLLLHGAGGPFTMKPFADLLEARGRTRVLLPTHPGFARTERPEALNSVRALAQHYAEMLDELDLSDVTVIGSSLGGWAAAELALLDSPRVGRVVIVNGVGIDVEGHPVRDVSGMTPLELAQYSFHDPSRSPAAANPGSVPAPGPNLQTLAAYTGGSMTAPALRERLAKIAVPVVVVWGESDRIVDLEYGRAYAAAIPGARFVPLAESGHLPSLETPELLLAALSTPM